MNTQTLYDRMSREFGVYGNSAQFEEAFMSALKSVKSDVRMACYVFFTLPDSLQDDIDIDDKYYSLLYNGCKFYINNGQEWNTVPKGDPEADYSKAQRYAHGEALMDLAPDTYIESE